MATIIVLGLTLEGDDARRFPCKWRTHFEWKSLHDLSSKQVWG